VLVGFVGDPYSGLESEGVITFVVQAVGTLGREVLIGFTTEDLATPQAVGRFLHVEQNLDQYRTMCAGRQEAI
jgi:hypothetical protein